MDVFAHALWTNALYAGVARKQKRKRSRKEIWIAIFWGLAPDIFSFTLYAVLNIFLTGSVFPAYAAERTAQLYGNFFHWLVKSPALGDPAALPAWLHMAYNITHSLVIFLAVFFIVWLIRKRKPYWLMGGWGLHIGIDIFSHSAKFFPTPILFPISSFFLSGISWGTPIFMIINYTALLIVYGYLYRTRGRTTSTS